MYEYFSQTQLRKLFSALSRHTVGRRSDADVACKYPFLTLKLYYWAANIAATCVLFWVSIRNKTLGHPLLFQDGADMKRGGSLQQAINSFPTET